MSKLKSKSKVYLEPSPWFYWVKIVISSDDGLKETSVFAGISIESMNEYCKLENGKELTYQQIAIWIDSVVRKCLNNPKILESKIWYHSHGGNQKVLEFLRSSLK